MNPLKAKRNHDMFSWNIKLLTMKLVFIQQCIHITLKEIQIILLHNVYQNCHAENIEISLDHRSTLLNCLRQEMY